MVKALSDTEPGGRAQDAADASPAAAAGIRSAAETEALHRRLAVPPPAGGDKLRAYYWAKADAARRLGYLVVFERVLHEAPVGAAAQDSGRSAQ